MAETLPSKRIAIVDIPEVRDFTAKFEYNFFVPDERVNDSGMDLPEFIRERPAFSFDNEFIDSLGFRRFTPRAVRFSWGPTAVPGQRVLGPARSKVIRSNLGKIHSEQTFVTDEYTNVWFQDNGKDQKMDFFIKRALEEIVRVSSTSDTPGVLGSATASQLDLVKFLKEHLSTEISSDFLEETFLDLTKEGVVFLDDTGKERTVDSLLKQLQSISVRTQLNNRVLWHLMQTTSNNQINVFDDESSVLLGQALQIQNRSLTQVPATLIRGRDYDFEVFDVVSIRKIEKIEHFDTKAQVVGYVINKSETTSGGRVVQHDPVVVEHPFSNAAVDLKVRYGSIYSYNIRSIALVELVAEDSDTSSLLAVTFLVASKPSADIVVKTVERVPPPPPADFRPRWNYSQNALYLTWSFPVNIQRDIKRFQVFRRKSIGEPFELLKMFDFDDSVVSTPMLETPDVQLVEKVLSPKTIYLDGDFNKNSKYIYALCSVDAHGFSSNYSMQLEVSFDRYKNKLKMKLLSPQGAPKAYPNLFLLQDVFVDTIRDTGHKRVRVVFNPEYLQVSDSKNQDLELLRTTADSRYRLQIINVDLQQQQAFSVRLVDRRKTRERDRADRRRRSR